VSIVIVIGQGEKENIFLQGQSQEYQLGYSDYDVFFYYKKLGVHGCIGVKSNFKTLV
jgi:hypothetical protein